MLLREVPQGQRAQSQREHHRSLSQQPIGRTGRQRTTERRCLMLPVGLCVQLACVWEATARKPGNVHRYRDFEDVTYLDFILSAAAIAPVLESAVGRPVGQTILDAVRATRLV